MSGKLLMIDNYDSFTFNLVQGFRALGAEVDVFRNDELTLEEAFARDKTHLIISPGPGQPHSAGISVELIKQCAGHVPILGVCLGHQSIVSAFGGKIDRAPRQMHGKISEVQHDSQVLFKGLSQPFVAGRYHSLTATVETMPEALMITARTGDAEIMGVRHRTLPIEGVQFHPESVLTPEGVKLMENFMAMSV